MLAVDIVKDEPRTELELWNRWKNNLQSELAGINRYAKKIEVKQIEKLDPSECRPGSRGRYTCEKLGEHSWFNHAMDKAY